MQYIIDLNCHTVLKQSFLKKKQGLCYLGYAYSYKETIILKFISDSTGIGGLNLLLKAGQHTMASSPVANHETLSTETGTIGSQQTKSPHLQSKSKRYPNETTDTRLSPTASVSQDPVSRSTCNKTKTDMSPFIHQQKATGSQNWSNCSQYPMKSCVNCQLCSRGDPLSSEGHSVPLRDAASHQVFSEVNEQAMVAGTSKAQTETAPAEDHSNSNTALLQLALVKLYDCL